MLTAKLLVHSTPLDGSISYNTDHTSQCSSVGSFPTATCWGKEPGISLCLIQWCCQHPRLYSNKWYDHEWIMNWKWYGKNCSWPNWRCRFYLEWLIKATRNIRQYSGLWYGIWSWHLPKHKAGMLTKWARHAVALLSIYIKFTDWSFKNCSVWSSQSCKNDKIRNYLRQVLMAVNMLIMFLWVVTLCGLVTDQLNVLEEGW